MKASLPSLQPSPEAYIINLHGRPAHSFLLQIGLQPKLQNSLDSKLASTNILLRLFAAPHAERNNLRRVATMIFDKLKKLDIVFDAPDVDCPPVYSSGDVVSGRVVLEFTGESRVDSLKLHAEGFAKVHWTESRSAGSSTAYTQNYSDEVEYLNRREVLLQAGQSVLGPLLGEVCIPSLSYCYMHHHRGARDPLCQVNASRLLIGRHFQNYCCYCVVCKSLFGIFYPSIIRTACCHEGRSSSKWFSIERHL